MKQKNSFFDDECVDNPIHDDTSEPGLKMSGQGYESDISGLKDFELEFLSRKKRTIHCF